MAKSKHPTDSLAAYALGALSEQESAQVAEHLRTCSECRRELAGYEETVAQLALAGPSQVAPGNLKERLMKKVRRSMKRTPWWAPASGRLQPAYAVFGLVLIVGLTVSNILLWRELQNQQTQSDQIASVATISLDNTGILDEGQGVLIISEDGQHATLIVEQLPALSQEQQYQLWLIEGDHLASAGVFNVSPEGYYSLPVFSEIPFGSYTAFGVSIEPYGGSQAPTGDIVLYEERGA